MKYPLKRYTEEGKMFPQICISLPSFWIGKGEGNKQRTHFLSMNLCIKQSSDHRLKEKGLKLFDEKKWCSLSGIMFEHTQTDINILQAKEYKHI